MTAPLLAYSIYWHLPVLVVIVSLVYSATRVDRWDLILKEAFRWGLRLLTFLGGIGVGLFLLAWWIDSGLGWRVPVAVGGAAALVAIVVSAYFSNRKTPPPRTRGRGVPMAPPNGFLAVVESQDPAVYDLAT